jgi:hypothetical protein
MVSELLSAKALAPILTKLSGSFAESAKGPAAKIRDQLKVKFKVGFDEYVQQQIKRCSTVKTIIGSNSPLSLPDLYVNLYVTSGPKRLRDDDLLEAGEKLNRFVFLATAGSGKTMLMRYLYFKFLQEQFDRLPIFVELRDLNEAPDQNMLEFIRGRIGEYIEGFTLDQLKYALKNDMLVLFLDGYDEIDHDKRTKRAREITSLAGRYDNLIIFISSRPDDSFSGWERFHTFRLEHFTKPQVTALIEKIPYDEDIKALFMKKLEGGLYETHKEFLVNPLLTTMMLVTLAQFADVPAKIHLFYEYAFEALFARHDVTKGGFRRKRHVDVPLDDYRRLFAYFCTISYLRETFSFSQATALEVLENGIRSSQIDVKKDEMLEDLSSCTCMLVRDGLDYVFSHRSFQEYFVAYFFSRVKVDEFPRVAPRLVARGTLDNVFVMISEMNKEKFEEVWALPQLSAMWETMEGFDVENDPVGYVMAVYETSDGALFPEARLTTLRQSTSTKSSTRHTLYRVYNLFERINSQLSDIYERDGLLVERIKKGQLLKDDKRFQPLRGDNSSAIFQFKLQRSDNLWLKESSFVPFAQVEVREVSHLLSELRERVAQRQAGAAAIFDF